MTTSTKSPTTSNRWTLRKRSAHERGHADHGWLHARFSFSFADYFDPDHMGFRSLRVMNNDIIEPQGGFPTHPHKDAEIFTYVISGHLAHRDSMGNGSVITSGNLQYMSAGSGVQHSEYNPSKETQTELYQIWLRPKESEGKPIYAEKQLGPSAERNALTLLFSGNNRPGATQIRQDAEIYFGKLSNSNTVRVPASEDKPYAWIQVIDGHLNVLGETLRKGDGLAVSDHPASFEIQASDESQFLLFQLS